MRGLELFWATISSFISNKFRSEDIPPVLTFGILFWLSNAFLLQGFRILLGVPDAAGRVSEGMSLSQGQILLGSISGVLVMLGIALLQVGESGIPGGLSKERAFLAGMFVGAFAISGSPIIRANSGSVAYAAIAATVYCITSLLASFALRHWRMRR